MISEAKTYKEIEQDWVSTLHTHYDNREIQTFFQFALEDLFGFTRTTRLSQFNEIPSAEIEARLRKVLIRLKTGEPYQYIIGFTFFSDLKIDVNPSVLIPRPETEELVHWIVETLPIHFSGIIEDWCSGSGCIALALKNELKSASVQGFEISESALEIARLNAQKLNLAVEFFQADALQNEFTNTIEVLVSNPPYIPFNEQQKMKDNVVKHEPEIALFVPNNDPLLFYRSIAENAIIRLVSGGFLFFEIHEDYAEETKKLIEEIGFINVELKSDLQGKWRMLKAQKK